MTSTEFSNSKYKPLVMPMPFGADSTNNYTTPGLNHSSSNFNFLDGFPTAYSSPHSRGGRYVTRQQMNGIGNIASRYEFFRRVGGIVTFDPDFANAIGGYPKGAVLDYLDGLNVHKVYSAVDNNTVNFITNGVDGVNWVFVNQDKGDTRSVLLSVDSLPVSGDTTLGVFKAKRSGLIQPQFNIEKTSLNSSLDIVSGPTSTGRDATAQRPSGIGIMICALGTGAQPSNFPSISITNGPTTQGVTQTVNWNGYMGIYGNLSMFLIYKAWSGNWIWKQLMPPLFNLWITEGTWYGVTLWHYPDYVYVSDTTTETHNTLTLNKTETVIGGSLIIYQ